MKDKVKKWIVIIGGIVVCVMLVALIGSTLQKETVEEVEIVEEQMEEKEMVVEELELDDDIVIAPQPIPSTAIEDMEIVNGDDEGTEQTIQPDAEKPTYTEEELTNPYQTPNGIPVEPPEEGEEPTPVENQIPSQSTGGLPGFDNVPYLGENEVIYAEDMYQNGNKVGIMD
ncbi:DUF6550 family protein [Chakrabartyella piscis]|uniref:DUF6550 family protein n=1 Tax=Chakrabartyella piscis TaxID=2918914 RepID=UPI0029588BB3|nr:DUF6550 family protein [Chakrabartyella piscis]